MTKEPEPHKEPTTPEEAAEWARRELAALGIIVPESSPKPKPIRRSRKAESVAATEAATP